MHHKVRFVDIKNDIAKEAWIAYDNSSIAEQDERGRLSLAEKKGQSKEKTETVLRGFKAGFSVEAIAKLTDLTVAETEEILREFGE